MGRSSLLRVMISSRCLDEFAGKQLSEIRKNLKAEIESLTIYKKQVFEVWINECTPPKGRWDSWEVCLQAVHDCDVLLILSNGNAGWAKAGGDIGICHAEMMTGLTEAPGKVRLINLGSVAIDESTDEGKRNKRFQDYIKIQNLFNGTAVNTVDQLRDLIGETLHEALISLAQAGVWEANRGRANTFSALDWNHYDLATREWKMRKVLLDTISERYGSQKIELKEKSENDEKDARAEKHVIVSLKGEDILFTLHAIPAAFSIGPAKEMVGQPFLYDHVDSDLLGKYECGGPVHIIACQKNATELQAIKLLGFPDATVVSTEFGVFVADNIQKVQLAFIINCSDEANTRHATQRFFAWLEKSGEDDLFVQRARARAEIVEVIAENIAAGSAAGKTPTALPAAKTVAGVGFSAS